MEDRSAKLCELKGVVDEMVRRYNGDIAKYEEMV